MFFLVWLMIPPSQNGNEKKAISFTFRLARAAGLLSRKSFRMRPISTMVAAR